MDPLISTKPPDLVIVNNKKKWIWLIADFVVSADYRVKLKEGETRDKYLNLGRELKKLWNMKVTVIPMVVGARGTIQKRLVTGLENFKIWGQLETIYY